MVILTAAAASVWAYYASLPGPWRFVVGLLTAMLAIIIFAASLWIEDRLRKRRTEDAGSPVADKHDIVDAFGKPYRRAEGDLSSIRIDTRTAGKAIATFALVATLILAGSSGLINKLSALLSPLPDTSVFMECSWTSLPISPRPEEGKAHILFLNRRVIQGFYDVSYIWPNKETMEKSKANPGIFCWKCVVSNHGPSNILYLAIPIDIWFGKGVGKDKIKDVPVVSGLDAGKNFEFYVVNDCNISALAIWEESTKAQVFGESQVRIIPLRRTYKNPVDQVMTFFASETNWSGNTCE